MYDGIGVDPDAPRRRGLVSGMVYWMVLVVRIDIDANRDLFGWTSNHEYRLDERDRTATRPRDDACTLWSGAGELEGMG